MSQTYSPRKKSGAWAILVALTLSQNNATKQMTKQQLIDAAQPYCDSNMRSVNYKDRYTAWYGKNTLISHQLIEVFDGMYQLTTKGYNLGQNLIQKEEYIINKLLIGGYHMQISNQLDQVYDLNKPIQINNKKYRLYLNIDSRERVQSNSNQLDIFKKLSSGK
eukprot:507493_1